MVVQQSAGAGVSIGRFLLSPIGLILVAIVFILLAITGIGLCLFAPNVLLAIALGIFAVLIIVFQPLPKFSLPVGLILMIFAILLFLKADWFGLGGVL